MTYHTGGLEIVQYKLTKKYLTTTREILIETYGMKPHDVIYSDLFKKYRKGPMKYKGLYERFLDRQPTPKRGIKHWEKLQENLLRTLNNNYKVCLHSQLGEEAAVALTQLGKQFVDAGKKIATLDGAEFNQKSTNFDDDYSAADMVGKPDAIIFYFRNSVQETDWKKKVLAELDLHCFKHGIPIFMSSNEKMVGAQNIQFMDGESLNALFEREILSQ